MTALAPATRSADLDTIIRMTPRRMTDLAQRSGQALTRLSVG